MAYDALAQSIALIGSRRVVRVARLSRRRRWVPMSVDVDDRKGLAVTSFARRGVGCTWHDVHVLVRREQQWVLLGGGGGTTDGVDLLADRPPYLSGPGALDPPGRTGAGGGPLLLSGSAGGVRDPGGGAYAWPWGGRWISHDEVLASAAVESLAIGGRVVPVPWHGRAVVVWTGRRGPAVRAQDRAGRIVGEVVLKSSS